MDGFEFKRHVDRAASLAPHDHTIQHLLGRFCFEVAELSWWERKMAGTLFAEPPMATMEVSFRGESFGFCSKIRTVSLFRRRETISWQQRVLSLRAGRRTGCSWPRQC